MKLENQVCRLELAKRLKELGVKQKSYFYWDYVSNGNLELLAIGQVLSWGFEESYDKPTGRGVSAFNVAELGEMLACEKVDLWMYHNDDTYTLKSLTHDHITQAPSEADARAKMLVYLLDNKLITLP